MLVVTTYRPAQVFKKKEHELAQEEYILKGIQAAEEEEQVRCDIVRQQRVWVPLRASLTPLHPVVVTHPPTA